MAQLDTYLRSASGLRLRTDGTCTFAFEGQRFAIEITEATGDFLFHADFGALAPLERRNAPRNFLQMLAAWNRELCRRHRAAGGGEEAAGLLRIDATEAAGPRVAFILYGHVERVRDAARFGRALDDFVDDALECADQIHGIRRREPDGAEWTEAAARRRGRAASADDVSFDGDKKTTAEVAGEIAGGDARRPKKTVAAGSAAGYSHHSKFSSSDVYHATTKNRIQKLLGIFSKADDEDAGADPAFLVDGTANEEGYLKPTIVLSRKPPDGKGDGAAPGAAPAARRGLFRGRPRRQRVALAGNSDVDGEHEGSFNTSIDIFDQPGPPAGPGRLHRSESVVDPPRRRRPMKRDDVHDEGWDGGASKGGSQHHLGRHHSAMSQSEPVLTQRR